MLNIVKKYISNEEAIDITVQQIFFIVIGIVAVVIVGGIAFSLLNSGKSQAATGKTDYDNLIKDLQGLQ